MHWWISTVSKLTISLVLMLLDLKLLLYISFLSSRSSTTALVAVSVPASISSAVFLNICTGEIRELSLQISDRWMIVMAVRWFVRFQIYAVLLRL